MSLFTKVFIARGKFLSIFFFSLIITACGGGGGGGGGNSEQGISLSEENLSFTANHDDSSPAGVNVTVTALSGTALSSTVYMELVSFGGAVFSANLDCPGNSASCNLYISPGSPGRYVNPGTYTGSATVQACATMFCNSGTITNGRKTVNVTYTVEPGFTVAPSGALIINGVEGVTTVPEQFTLTNSSGTVQPWSSTILYPSSSVRDWLSLTPDQNSASSSSGTTIDVVTSDLPPGSYSATVEFRIANTTRSIRRNVGYTVATALNTSSSANFTVDTNTVRSDVNRTITIASNYPAGNSTVIDWQASEDIPWLQLTSTSGDTDSQNQLTFSLIPEQLEALPIGNYSGAITLTSNTANVSDKTINVSLSMLLPMANFASPYIARVNDSAEIIIRGSGLSSLPGTVSFGGNAAINVIRDSDTQLRATHPALTSGLYAIDVGIAANSLGLNRSAAQLLVLPATNLPSAEIVSAGTKSAVVFDAERNIIYAAGTQNNEIERHVWNGSLWNTDSLSISNLHNISMLPNGKELLVLSDDSIVHVNIDGGFNIVSTNASPDNANQPNTLHLNSVAVGNDGQAIAVRVVENFPTTEASLFKYQTTTNIFTSYGYTANGDIKASKDGSTLYLVSKPRSNGVSNILIYDTLSDLSAGPTLLSVGVPHVSVSRTGDKAILGINYLYDNNFSLLGTLTAAETLEASVISSSSDRAYAYGTSGVIYTYDLTSPDGAGGFNQVGSPIGLTNLVGNNPVMTISHDGLLIIIAGSDRIVVQPTP